MCESIQPPRFAAAFADQPDDDRIAPATADDRFQQRALSGARCAEDADARPAPQREQRVDRAHAGPKRLRYRNAFAWTRRQLRWCDPPALRHRPAVERPAARVERAPKRTRSEREFPGRRLGANGSSVRDAGVGVVHRDHRPRAVDGADSAFDRLRLRCDFDGVADSRARNARADQSAARAEHATLRDHGARSSAHSRRAPKPASIVPHRRSIATSPRRNRESATTGTFMPCETTGFFGMRAQPYRRLVRITRSRRAPQSPQRRPVRARVRAPARRTPRREAVLRARSRERRQAPRENAGLRRMLRRTDTLRREPAAPRHRSLRRLRPRMRRRAAPRRAGTHPTRRSLQPWRRNNSAASPISGECGRAMRLTIASRSCGG